MLKGTHHTKETKDKLRKINFGKRHTDKAKLKVSKAMKGRKITWNDKISKALTGKKKSKEAIEKNRLAHLGKKHSKGTKEKMSIAQSGKKLSDEHKRKISETRKRLKLQPEHKCGKYHWAWKGGITPLNNVIYNSSKYKEWRDKVFKRDNYTCQDCDKKGGWNKELKIRVKIEAHHKKEFCIIIEENNIKTLEDALNCKELWDIDNGQTLCKECHDKKRKYWGNTKR